MFKLWLYQEVVSRLIEWNADALVRNAAIAAGFFSPRGLIADEGVRVPTYFTIVISRVVEL
jgi:hypothetical protein